MMISKISWVLRPERECDDATEEESPTSNRTMFCSCENQIVNRLLQAALLRDQLSFN